MIEEKENEKKVSILSQETSSSLPLYFFLVKEVTHSSCFRAMIHKPQLSVDYIVKIMLPFLILYIC